GTSIPDASRLILENVDSNGYMLGVLLLVAVPSWMTPSDFLAFCLRSFYEVRSSHRDVAPNRSIALIRCRKVESALEFAEAYDDGKAFNSITTCHVVHITSMSIDANDSVPLALSRLGSAKAPVF
ncbi:hypothetical protein F5888DRAFT_1696134, partial [Russula emetica]